MKTENPGRLNAIEMKSEEGGTLQQDIEFKAFWTLFCVLIGSLIVTFCIVSMLDHNDNASSRVAAQSPVSEIAK